MNMTHPVLQGMLMTGCLNQQNILMAFHTYMELCEVKLMWDVDYCYEKELGIIYLKGKLKENSENVDYFVPVSSSNTISPGWINKVQNKIGQLSNSSFTLVIKNRDSSSVYYKVSNGLVPPLSPESAKKKKCLEEKQSYLWNEIKKRRSQLFSEAKESLLPAGGDSPAVVDTVPENTANRSVDGSSDDDVIIQDSSNVDTNSRTSRNSVSDLTKPQNDCIEIIELF